MFIFFLPLSLLTNFFLDSHQRKERKANKNNEDGICRIRSTSEYLDDNLCFCCSKDKNKGPCENFVDYISCVDCMRNSMNRDTDVEMGQTDN